MLDASCKRNASLVKIAFLFVKKETIICVEKHNLEGYTISY